MEHKDNVKYSETFLFIKGRVGDLVQNIFCYAGWNSLYIPLAITNWSNFNYIAFISSVEGIGPNKYLSNHNLWSEG